MTASVRTKSAMASTGRVFQFKLVLLGDQTAGKSSLADSLVRGRPATRAHSDRTVGIDVHRWWVGRGSQLVANIYDAAGQRVYRATHGLFMSPGALFLHVVRADQPEEAAVAAGGVQVAVAGDPRRRQRARGRTRGRARERARANTRRGD